MSRLLLGVLLLAIGAAGGIAGTQFLSTDAPDTEESEEQVTERHASVGALGRIEPRGEVLDIDAAIGDRVIELFIAENDFVEAGDELARLESYDVRLAERDQIAAQLVEAKRQADATKKLGEARIEVAEMKLNIVQRLEPIRINAQASRVEALEADEEMAKLRAARISSLIANSTVTQSEHDQARLSFERISASVGESRSNLNEMKDNFELAESAAKLAWEEANAWLAHSQSEIPIASLEAQLAVAEVRLKQSTIRAPRRGKILEIFTYAGERIGNDPILQMGDVEEMHAVAEVYETDIQAVRLGQSATISSRAFPDKLTGKVIQIGSQIFKNDVLDVDPAADADARVVEVRIRLDQPQVVAALTNLQVDVLIETSNPGETAFANAH